jgi:hypothetical protein
VSCSRAPSAAISGAGSCQCDQCVHAYRRTFLCQ